MTDLTATAAGRMEAATTPRTSDSNLAVFVRWGLIALALVAVFVAPSLLSAYAIGIGVIFLLTLPGAIALNIVFGFCGQVSVGNAAFLAVGAFYAAGVTHASPSTPAWVVLVTVAVVGAIGGLIVGAPAVRVRGLLLLISTLAFHFIILYVVQRYQTGRVGQAGFLLPPFELFGFKPLSQTNWFEVFGVFSVLCLALMTALRHSSLGRRWLSIRENEVAAEVMGVRIARAKLTAFVVSSMVISVQGALFAYYTSTLQYEIFTLDLAIQYIAIVIIGGLASVGGTAAGTLIVVGLPYALRSLSESLGSSSGIAGFITKHMYDLQSLVYGALIVGFLLFSPDGLDGLARRLGRAARRVFTTRRVLTARAQR